MTKKQKASLLKNLHSALTLVSQVIPDNPNADELSDLQYVQSDLEMAAKVLDPLVDELSELFE